MCREHLIAKQIIDEKIKSQRPFSYKEINGLILEKGGILRISTGITIGNYLTQLEDFGIIKFNPKKSRFTVNMK